MKSFRILPLALCILGAPAFAVEKGEYSLNGFGTAAFSRLGGASDAKGYGIQGQTTDSWRGDQLSKIGGQFSYGLTDELSATVQGMAHVQVDTWKLDVTWAYLAYEVSDQLIVRAGKMRPNAFLYSETLNVGYSYPWLRLPDEVYSQMPVEEYDGVDALYRLPFTFGSLELQGSYGQTSDQKVYLGLLDDSLTIDFKEMKIASARLNLNDLGSLRYSYMQAYAKLPTGFPSYDGTFKSLGYQFDNGTWMVNAEATNRRTPGAIDDAFYIMAGHRFGDFMPHVTYAQWDQRDGGRQSSWSYGLNYNLAPNVTLKGEYKRVDTTNGFLSAFTPNSFATSTLDGDIISFGVDFVF